MLHPYLDTEAEEDLMDLIDPDLEYAVPILNLAGRILYGAIKAGVCEDDADYERALLRSVELASGEWIV